MIWYLENGRFLMTTGSKGVRRYFADSLYVPPGLRGRVRRALHLSSLHRTSASTGTELLRELLAESRFDIDAVPQGICLRDYASSDRERTITFFFERESSAPLFVVKAQRPPNKATASLRVEADALEAMRAFLPPALRPTLPEVRQLHLSTKGELLVTTALPGRSAYVDIRGSLVPSKYVEQHFAAASRWLAEFHNATQTGESRDVGGTAVVHCASQGDFWPRNVLLVGGGGTGVVDWEHFSPAASPFVDLFHYALTYGLSYPWHVYRQVAPREAFRRTFLEANRVSQAASRFVRDYAERRGMHWPLLRQAFRQYLATRGRMDADAPERPGVEGLAWTQLTADFDKAQDSFVFRQ